MATSSTYYLNGPTLGSATAVFLDDALSVCAPDGYYSDGTISRQQVGCSLLPQQPCDCSIACGFKGSDIISTGVYNYNINTGPATGAIVITINAVSYPVGVLASFNGIDYNYANSFGRGYLSGSIINEPSYFGLSVSDCGISGGTFTLDNYVFNGSIFNSLGTQTVNVNGAQLDLVSGTEKLELFMIIPKTVFGDQLLTLKLIYPCDAGGDTISCNIDCPVELESINSSAPSDIPSGICLLPTTSTYYIYHIGPTPPTGEISLWAFLFTDINGQFPAPDGWYHAAAPSGVYFHVLNGIIVEIKDC